VRSCQTAAELDPEFTPEGYCAPNPLHLSTGSIAMLKARPRMGEVLRTLPGSSLVVAPTDRDLAEPALAQGLEEAFAGGGYTARQRAALLQMAWDHVGSALDHRESVYELHANGGIPSWRGRLRRSFNRYEELANGVLQHLNLPMPKVDLQSIRNMPLVVRRPVNPTVPPPKPAAMEPTRNPVTAGKVP
jgi:aromatic ring hydroxylase